MLYRAAVQKPSTSRTQVRSAGRSDARVQVGQMPEGRPTGQMSEAWLSSRLSKSCTQGSPRWMSNRR